MTQKIISIASIFQSACAVALAMSLVASKSESLRFRKEAIERGYAEHNRVTGEWQWVEPATKP